MGVGAHPNPKIVGFKEFVALIAALTATQAIAIDGMLPALPVIASALAVPSGNGAQLIVTSFVTGVGLGQVGWGILSDRFGRRPILLLGLFLYVIAAVLCSLTTSFHSLLVWRFIHGIAAGSSVIGRSCVRDQYTGRRMARVMSLTFIVFLMVPVLAPTLGQALMALAPWRTIFVVFGGFALVVLAWVALRLPETLHAEYRLTLNVRQIAHALGIVLLNRVSICYTLTLAIMFGSILAYVAMVQQVFQDVFHRASLMPEMFAICASAMGVTSYLNSRIVERVGMRIISQTGLLCFIAVTALHVLVIRLGLEDLTTFVVLQSITMACIGVISSNCGAMAMEPVGAVAGVGASLQGMISTTGGALVGAWVGKWFNGTTMPLALGALVCGLLSFALVTFAERGRLFSPHHEGELTADFHH
jgi:DHA1 family bicyclomycin/chloramphenicol resistance-like MFS transporter